MLDQFGLTKIRKTKANRVSGGEGRRLEIARSLITEPKLIMLDEPFAGIDPKTVAEIQDQIRDLVERYNIGILLTDHQFRETLEVTDRCYLIREGRVFAYGNREQILNNPEVRRHYIGERFDVGHLLEKASAGRHPARPRRGSRRRGASRPPRRPRRRMSSPAALHRVDHARERPLGAGDPAGVFPRAGRSRPALMGQRLPRPSDLTNGRQQASLARTSATPDSRPERGQCPDQGRGASFRSFTVIR